MAPIFERLKSIYAAADAAVAAAGPRCDSSGRCCRFKEYGHTLFVSQFEADHLLAHAPPFVGPVTDALCPFQVENLCTAREPRPLACRVYFCDPAYQEIGAEISEKYLGEIKRLADEFEVGWRYAPLQVFLEEHLRTVPPRPESGMDAPSERVPRGPESLRHELPMTTME